MCQTYLFYCGHVGLIFVVKHTSIRFEVVRFDSLDFIALNRYNVVKHTSDKKFMRILVQR